MKMRLRREEQRGVALVLVLVFLVLATGLVVAYFARTVNDLQFSNNSYSAVKAEDIASSATDIIVGNLKQEIIAGAASPYPTPDPSPNITLYIPPQSPSPSPASLHVLPVRNTKPAPQTVNGSVVDVNPNLVRISTDATGEATLPTPGLSSNASSALSTTASANGRSISPARWNKHYLLQLANPGSTTDTTPANFTAPSWVFVTSAGPQVIAAPTPSVIGRYAYAIYDEGGLLDANVAGNPAVSHSTTYPSPSPVSTPGGATTTYGYLDGGKGYLAYADLTQIGLTSAQVDNLLGWRNYTSTNPTGTFNNYTIPSQSAATSFYSYLTGNNTAFTQINVAAATPTPTPVANPGSTDQAFLSRQALINFMITTASSSGVNALPYLGTHSRDLDQPSYFPDPNRNKVSTLGVAYDPNYAASASYPAGGDVYDPVSDDVFNPDVMSIRVTTSFQRNDKTTAKIGDPLLNHRFPLSRLNNFNHSSDTAALQAIQTYFCMVPHTDAAGTGDGAGSWDYYDPDKKTVVRTLPKILTLSAVAAKGRDATFWEILQAGILKGSLGVEINVANGNGVQLAQNAQTARSIFQIGLSMISQYMTDNSTPVVLWLSGDPTNAQTSTPPVSGQNPLINMFIAGDGNFPYISWIATNTFFDTINPQTTIAPTSSPAGSPTPAILDDTYLLFGLWNPHRNSVVGSTGGPSASEYRIRAPSGQTYLTYTGLPTPAPITSGTFSSPGILQFHTSASRSFNLISGLKVSDADLGSCTQYTTFPYPPVTSVNPKQVGFFLGQIPIPTPAPSPNNKLGPVVQFNQGITLVLEKQTSHGWLPYEAIPYLKPLGLGLTFDLQSSLTVPMNSGYFDILGSQNQTNYWTMRTMIAFADPRSCRFGTPMGGYNQALEMAYQFDLINSTASVPTAPAAAQGQSINGIGVPDLLTPVFHNNDGIAKSVAPADAAINQVTDFATYYFDRDGVVRKADNNPANPAFHDANSPYSWQAANNPYDGTGGRPIMLNRPFRSVAEIGYAYRDVPFRTLNFSSADSADGGLLDLFCLNENVAPTRAGVVDINSASPQVLAALLNTTARDPAATDGMPLSTPSTTPTSSPSGNATATAGATAIATAIRNVLGPNSSPTFAIQNTADMPKLIDKLGAALTAIGASPLDTLKFKRETISRALSDVSNTRTWNLMIDVIAQSGKFGSAATTINNFTVQGERRYWVHVSIDRYTGQVIDTQTEAVFE